MKSKDALYQEVLDVAKLINHGRNTGQDKGVWMENLEKELRQLLCQWQSLETKEEI